MRFPHVSKSLLLGLALPPLLRAVNAGKWLREKLLHVPQAVLNDACAAASDLIPPGQPRITPEMWRAVEAVQAAIVEGKIEGGLGL